MRHYQEKRAEPRVIRLAERVRQRPRLKILYLLTTFPALSETFVRREVRALGRLNIDLEIHSLWGGEPVFEFHRVHLFPKERILTLLWWLPYWLMRKPRAFVRLGKDLCAKKPGSLTDFGATLLGIAFALTHAHHFAKRDQRPHLIHAGWAAMPATAAQLMSALIEVPFTFQANAYDIFLDGGDWLLPGKLRDAACVMTATEYARDELLGRGAQASKVTMIRRGLESFPDRYWSRTPRTPLRLLSIGRLVDKKGYYELLEILAKLKARGLHFEARIIGAGPLQAGLETRIEVFDLGRTVKLLGAQSFTACRQQLQWADVFLFTGKVSKNGDRDGLPNAICEAMACGVPVVSTPVSGVPEAIRDGKNGVLIPDYDAEAWHAALIRLRDDDEFYLRIRDTARAWVQENFAIEVNVKKLAACFLAAAARRTGTNSATRKKKEPAIAAKAGFQ